MPTATADRRALARASKIDPLAASALADLMEEQGEAGLEVRRLRLFAAWFPALAEGIAAGRPSKGQYRVLSLGDGLRISLRFCPQLFIPQLRKGICCYWSGNINRNCMGHPKRGPKYLPRRVRQMIDAYLAARP